MLPQGTEQQIIPGLFLATSFMSAAPSWSALALWLHLDDVDREPAREISLGVIVLVVTFLVGVHDLFPFVRGGTVR